MKIRQSAPFRYCIALLFVGAALGLSLSFEDFIHDSFLIFFLSAVMLTSWFGRTGPGFFSVLLSMIVVAYFFIPPHRAFAVDVGELPYFLSFLLVATVTSWLGSTRRHTEEKQRAHLDELFEQTPEAIILMDLEYRVRRVNKRFTHIFGYTSQDAVGQSSIDLLVPPELRDAAARNREQLAIGHEVSIETVRRGSDGTSIDVSEVSFPVIVDGECIAYYAIFRDISESKRAFENLQKTQADLAHLSRITTMGELASSIAHEINQPIGAIATNGNAAARWLAQSPPHVADAGEAIDCIVRDANRAAQVIGRIRDLLRKHPPSMVQLDLNEIVRETLTLTSYETNRRSTLTRTNLDRTLPLVLGDRILLQQVLLNLIMNSLDAMNRVDDRPRELLIMSSRNANTVTLEVQDVGQGWEDKHSNSIFDPFFTTKQDGLGMGLTISRSIIEAHGGRMWPEKRKPHGATLKITLPAVTGAK